MTVNQQTERKSIDEVTLAGSAPTDGKGVIDYIFPLTEEAAKPLTLHSDCKKQMHTGRGPLLQSNDESFDACFRRGGFSAAEPQLKFFAYQHGVLSRIIQLMLVPGSTEVSLQAYEAAGLAIRRMCTMNCDGAKGQWCFWP
jgi:hypothetical protein